MMPDRPETFPLASGFDLVASVKLARPHEAGRAFAALTDRDQVDVLFGAAEAFAGHEYPSMQYAYMEKEFRRQPRQVQQAIRAFLRNLTIYLDDPEGGA
jgi:hypothetical protein